MESLRKFPGDLNAINASVIKSDYVMIDIAYQVLVIRLY